MEIIQVHWIQLLEIDFICS